MKKRFLKEQIQYGPVSPGPIDVAMETLSTFGFDVDLEKTKDRDMVNHPPHYTNHPSGVECIDIVEWMSFNLGNAVKYCWRSGLKDFEIEDLKKAAWYIEREIKRLTKEEKNGCTIKRASS